MDIRSNLTRAMSTARSYLVRWWKKPPKSLVAPIDSDIDLSDTVKKLPSRKGRIGLLIAFIVIGFISIIVFSVWFGQQFFPGNGLMAKLSASAGFAAAIAIIGQSVEKFFIIRNSTTGMFVTQNTFASLVGEPDLNVAYGPGTHVSYPWERRLAGNNILIEDAAVEFVFTVQRPDGNLFGKGSYRLRPDIHNPVTFLSSVASVGKEIQDLIIVEIQRFFTNETAPEAAGKLGPLNDHLEEAFIGKRAQAEANNGVCISDVSISELIPGPELQRTMAGISEARAIQQAVELFLHMDRKQIGRALRNGTLTQQDITRAREHVLAVSGNQGNLEIKRQEFDLNIRGLSPELTEQLTNLANTPAAQAAAAAAIARRRGSGGKKAKGSNQP